MPIDLEMPDGVVVSFPDDYTKEQIQELTYQKFPELDPMNKGNEFTRGLKRGVVQTKALIGEGVPAVAQGLSNEYLGTDFDTQENLEAYQKQTNEAQRDYPTSVPSFRDIKGLGGVGDFIAATAGEQIPQLGTSLVGGGVGGFAAKQGVATLAKRAGKELTQNEIDKSFKKGLLGGSLLTSSSQNIPESYFNLLSQGADEPSIAVLTGALKSSLDVIPQVKLLERVLGPNASNLVGDSILKSIGAGAARTGLQEGVTESAQEGIDLFAEKFVLDSDLNTPENIDRLINAGLKGAVGGATFGGAAGAVQGVDAKAFDPNSLSPQQKQQLDTQFEEEVIGASDPRSPTVSDDVLQPLYVDKGDLDRFASNGFNTESISLLSPAQVAEVDAVTDRLSSAQNVYDLKLTQIPDTPDIQAIKTRREGIQNKNRTDTDFFIGDGEVVLGAPNNLEATIIAPTQNLTTGSTLKLGQLAGQTFDKEVDLSLPPTLKGAKLHYQQSRLDFESDYDKALYIVSNKKDSARRKDYLQWLESTTGKTEPELVKEGLDLRNKVKPLMVKGEESVKIPSLAKPPKTTIKLPKYGDIQSDLVTPTIVANNLSGIEMSQNGIKKLQPQLQQLQRITKEIAGPNSKLKGILELNPKKLYLDPEANGAYLNTVATALNATNVATLDETGLLQTWDFIETSGMLSQQDIQRMDEGTINLIPYINEGAELAPFDYQAFMSTKEGREEVRAHAFSKWFKDQRNGVDTKNLPKGFGKSFRKGRNFLEKFGSSLKGLGFTSIEDVFTATGDKRVSDTLEDINYNNRISKLQRISKDNGVAHEESKYQTRKDYKDVVQQARLNSNTNTKVSGKQIGFFGRYINSLAHAASRNPFIAQIYSAVERRLLNSQHLLEGYMDQLQGFPNQDKAVRHRLHNLADYLRDTKQEAKFDTEGRLVFERDGNKVRIGDVELAKQFQHMQNAYKKVLDDYGNLMREEMHKEMPDVLPTANFNSVDIDRALAKLEGTEGNKRKVERLNDAKQLFNDFTMMRQRVFVPHMRFGNWGITVRDKETKEQVGFYTLEGGGYRKLYNKYQLESTVKELKEKYADTNKYEVIGGNGVVTNFTTDNLVPFKLTHASLKNQVDTRFVNIELLSSLLASKDLSVEDYEQIRTEVFNDILKKGFANRFSEAKGVAGYSKDWDRVQHAYLTGASHYLSGLGYQRELATLQTEADKLDDTRLKDLALTYLDYTNSPHEDFQMLRSFNFMWTMGANISTALLQLFTLPTTTLGAMTQYNPNPIANMAYTTKWLGLAKEFFPSVMKTVQTHNGLFYADFRNDEIINDLISKGKMTEQQSKYLYKMSAQLRGFLTEEYSGFKPFETRSLGGSLKGKLSTGANWLGIPISTMEQMTRFATAMGTYDMLTSNPKALQRAEKILSKDHRFQAQNTNLQDFDFAENVAKFTMDEAHAVFGKVGRAPFQKGVGGALFFPFMTYPQQALEFILRSATRGPGGLRGSLTTLGALYMFSGLLGLPGAELLKEVYEEIEKQVTGSEEDLDFVIREKIYEKTGDVRFAKFITQGIGRGYADLDIARRVGLPIPGQDLMMTMMGIQGTPTDLLGVSGSLLNSMASAWQEGNRGASGVSVLSAMLPVAPANVLKAIAMNDQGVATRSGLQLLTPEEVTLRTKLARSIGVGTDQIATKREEAFAKIISDRRFKPGFDNFRARAKRLSTALVKAQEEKDWATYREKEEEYQELMNEMEEFAIINNIAPDFPAFNRSVLKSVNQRLDPTVRLKDVRKLGRESFFRTQEAIGLGENNEE